MRASVLAVIGLLCLPCAAAAAPLSLPVVADEIPRALVLGGDGRGALVTQTPESAGGSANQAIVAIPTGTRRTFQHNTILARAPRADGGVDLLVRRGADLTGRGDLVLRRVMPSGRVLDLWATNSSATEGALARGSDRTVALWAEGAKLRTITRPDGGLPTRVRGVPLSLRGVIDLGLTLDARGRLTAAVATGRDGLVVAALTRRGAIVRRQSYRAATGLVHMAVTAGGRAGVLIEDTGIEGEGGECVADGGGRHIRAITRAPRAERFGALQLVESPPFGCGSGGALLRALAGDGLVAIFQGGSYDHPPLLVRIARAASGRRFARPATLAADARADTAVVTRGGELVVGLLRRTTQPEVYSGSLGLLRVPGGLAEVDPGPAFAPLVSLDGDGDADLVWRTPTALKVSAP